MPKGPLIWSHDDAMKRIEELEADLHAAETILAEAGTENIKFKAKVKRLREAIEDALGRYQTTHIHAALRKGLEGE